jgi:hypothetical protein
MTTLSYILNIEKECRGDKNFIVNKILQESGLSFLTEADEESSRHDKIYFITEVLDDSPDALGFYLNQDVATFFTRKNIYFHSEDGFLNIVYNAHISIFIRCFNGLEEAKKIVIQVEIPEVLTNIFNFKYAVSKQFTEGAYEGFCYAKEIDDDWILNNI